MLSTSQQSSRAWIWQGFLLVLPVVVLAAMGALFIRQDRGLADKEARERCQELAEDLARQCLAALLPASVAELRSDLPVNSLNTNTDRYVAFFDAQTKLRFPPPYAAVPTPPPLDLQTLTANQRDLWVTARSMAYTHQDAKNTLTAWERFLASAPPESFAAIAKFSYAMELERQNRPEAVEQYRQISENDADVSGESGVPLKPMADWHRWQLLHSAADVSVAKETNNINFPLDRLCLNWITNPSAISATLLARANDIKVVEAANSQIPGLLQLWQRHEITRALFHQEENRLRNWRFVSAPADSLKLFWTESDTMWLGAAFLDDGRVFWQPLDTVREKIAQAYRLSKTIPDYATVRIDLAGTNLLSTLPGAHGTNSAPPPPALGMAYSPGRSGPLKIAFYLSDPRQLYAQQRARALWIAALITVAIVGALIGLAATWRAMQRQLRLIEMKSNFVSSVTHELRAPLASVRLMAESLERGKISQPEKRQEYFRFIVQECRRLSGLIENVLDFARIEQGRKEYQSEAVALEELVRQTTQVLEPYAAEREVRLSVTIPSVPSGGFPLVCDARAIQQAMVNLIDNAVKHSPAGSEVTIGLEASTEYYRLWVEDHGPGIPPEEHERIFEQFYRRGSELRRESAGVGIGLTLVKHIVEAHHGRVAVRSDVGQGSRFTLEFPIPSKPTPGKPPGSKTPKLR